MDIDGGVAISLVFLTFCLVIATLYYARQTRNTVDELKRQRERTEERDEVAKVARVLAARSNLLNELRQIAANLEGKAGTGRLFMRLPTEAWQATFSSEYILPKDLRDELFQIYAEVERMNAIGEMLLAGRTGRPRTGTASGADSDIGLERASIGGGLAKDIREAIDKLAALPKPT